MGRLVFKDKIPSNSEIRVWVAPSDGATERYAAIGRMVDDNGILIWDGIDLRDAVSEATAIRHQLSSPRMYSLGIRVVFDAPELNATIEHRVVKPDGRVFGVCPSQDVPEGNDTVGRQSIFLKTVRS